MAAINQPGLLSIIFLLPILGSIPTYFIGRIKEEYSKWSALFISGFVMLVSILAGWMFIDNSILPDLIGSETVKGNANTISTFLLTEKIDLIPQIGVSYHLGVDGLSLPLVLLTTFIMFVSILGAMAEIDHREAEFYALMLILETGIVGTFIALDLIVFYFAWELTLIPMFFLIGIWGHGEGERIVLGKFKFVPHHYAAVKFFIFTFVGSIFMLLGFVALWLQVLDAGTISYKGTPIGSFDLLVIIQTVKFDPTKPIFLFTFLVILFGFIVKLPSFPLHLWLPDAHVRAPTAGSMVLAGLLLKMGGYGIMRFAGWVFPEMLQRYDLLIGGIGLISLLWGAMVAFRQADLKRLIAYSSIGHMGIVLLGVASQTAPGFAGALYMMIAHGVISPLLFFLSGVIKHHVHTRIIENLKGLTHHMPTTTAVLVYTSFASAGLPGLAGFIAEFSAFVGIFSWSITIAAIGVLGIIITAAYYLWMLQRIVFGTPEQVAFDPKGVTDSTRVENAVFFLLGLFTLLLGIYPLPIFDMMNAAMTFFAAQF